MLFLQAGASMVQTAIGVEQPGRRLTDTERAQLYQVYGDSIDYDIIRVKEGGGINELLAEHTVGNTVYMHADDFNSDGTLNFKGLVTLSHEVGHVWQGQNGGADYIGNALWANFWFQLTTGDRNNAYDWRKALAGGASFETMNAEQQAQVMEDIRIALIDDGRIGANDLNSYSTASYTKAELRFLRSVWRESQQGDGAV